MPITSKQREQRRKHIGASDVPAIMGALPWRTPYDIWLDKTNQLVDKPPSDQMVAGTYLEDGILDWWSDKTGYKLRKNQRRVDKIDLLAVNCDALVVGTNEPVEAKAVFFRGDEWGEENTDEVPMYVLLQVMAQIAVAEADGGHVAALVNGQFKRYRIKRHDELIKAMYAICRKFWHENVVGGAPPDADVTYDILKRVRHVPNRTVILPAKTVMRWELTKQLRKQAEAMEKEAKVEVQKLMLTQEGMCELGEVDGGWGTVTNRMQSRSKFDMETFKADHPELYDKYAGKTEFSVMTYRKPKQKEIPNVKVPKLETEAVERFLCARDASAGHANAQIAADEPERPEVDPVDSSEDNQRGKAGQNGAGGSEQNPTDIQLYTVVNHPGADGSGGGGVVAGPSGSGVSGPV